jgi:hypothetical protein
MYYCQPQPQPMMYCQGQAAYPPEDYEGHVPYAYVPYGYQGFPQGSAMPMYDPAYKGDYGESVGSAGEPGGIPYVVKEGDTLYTIAQAHGVMWQDLMRYNQLSDAQGLYAGQRLLIPR